MSAATPRRLVYLDNHATTPTDPRVVEAMQPYFTQKFGNPHSRDHAFGWEADEAVEKARKQVADLIGADPKEIVFTSGATEANNLAIIGLARFFKGRKGHIVTLATEHKCVLESCRAMEAEGYRVTYLPVDGLGRITPQAIEAAITDDTLLVSVMAAHNEIGVIQPLAEIGALCRSRKVFFHTDAAQAAGKIPLDVEAMKIDLMSLSSHKVYGPMGLGALYVRRRPRVRLAPLIHGGGQERGLRSGTLPTPLCVGMGEAFAIAGREMPGEANRLSALRDRLRDAVTKGLDGVQVNGDMAQRLPGNLNLSFEGVDAARLMGAVSDLAVSSGSACTSASVEPSYVLKALGLSDERAAASIRIGLGRFNTEADVDYAAQRLIEAVKRLRAEGTGAVAPARAPATV
jgi:cysteine desulfurase